ncbi:MAG TPA: hypothetical protein VNU44_06235 [Bryobacteraceae bacterium]|nr:hypothetical protein [Bryobacteraceae bacterium]
MRLLLLLTALLLTGCGPGLVFNMSPEMTKDQMLARADHVFIGVIEKQEYENWLFLNVPGAKRGDWTILKRQVRVETLLRGQESRQSVTIYEFFGTGGASGDWNSTYEGNATCSWSASRTAATMLCVTGGEASSGYIQRKA